MKSDLILRLRDTASNLEDESITVEVLAKLLREAADALEEKHEVSQKAGRD